MVNMYSLEIEKAVNEINKIKAKKVLIQLPDGLKPEAKKIQDELSLKTNAQILIWAGSCFGACDVPNVHAKNLGVDMIIQWGHTKWK